MLITLVILLFNPVTIYFMVLLLMPIFLVGLGKKELLSSKWTWRLIWLDVIGFNAISFPFVYPCIDYLFLRIVLSKAVLSVGQYDFLKVIFTIGQYVFINLFIFLIYKCLFLFFEAKRTFKKVFFAAFVFFSWLILGLCLFFEGLGSFAWSLGGH